MRVILDECLPRVLADDLPGHEVQTVQQAGLGGKKNGELLKLIGATRFGAFVTVDKKYAGRAAHRWTVIRFGCAARKVKWPTAPAAIGAQGA